MNKFLITALDELVFRPAVWLLSLRPSKNLEPYWQDAVWEDEDD